MSAWLREWGPKLGPPTCHKGCSNCCIAPVCATSAEAAYLIGYIQAQSPEEADRLLGVIDAHVDLIARHFASIGRTDNPVLEVWKLGKCPFLVGNACGIYPARPYACRAVHVWHDNQFCGSSVGYSRVPLELIESRDRAFWETLKREVVERRRPFWGQLSVVSYFVLLHAELYFRGGDLRTVIDAPWMETGLVQFPPDESLEGIAHWIDRRIGELEELYSDPKKCGLPSASNAKDAVDLDCEPSVKLRILREKGDLFEL